ncbi:LysR family transcriptional regulator [Ancylobacter sonchi]|uniref:LysR family transcriptional regulator n=1 Tax=Ancylobacter sonchi TaxID=1937790 RepID=UPI001BD5E5A5|nr:LysR family transcriptional regulator [Ancylobacter sonchi]MBS7535014.1 LysR family transcriptional regulator [Ancylobacter sonchi]
MNETTFDWSDLRIFLTVARAGGLAAAAKLIGQSPATLGRHIVNLERALGEELFRRLPSGYELTDAGQRRLVQVEAVEGRIVDIVRGPSERDAGLPIRISAGTWMTWFLTRHIAELGTAGRFLVFSAAEERHNIGRRETLIGIRNQRPTTPGLAVRRTARVRFAPYALNDGSAEDGWIACTVDTPSARWVRNHRRISIRMEVSHPRTLLDLALAGAGQVVLPCFIGAVHEGLVRTGPIIEELSHDQWLVVHGEDRNRNGVRETIDAIASLIVAKRSLFAPMEEA